MSDIDLEKKMLKTLKSKIIVTFMAIIFAIVTLLLLSFNYIVVDQLKLQLAEELKNEINLIEYSLNNVNDEKLNEYLNNLKNFSGQLKYNVILSDINKNKIFRFYSDTSLYNKDYQISFLRKSGRYTLETKNYENDARTFFVVTKSIDVNLSNEEKSKFGYITIETDLEAIEKFSNNVRFKIIVAALVLFVFGLLIIRYFTDRVTKPVNSVIDSLKEYSKTGIPRLIEFEGSQEFKFLVESINNLMTKIEYDMNELKKLERYRSEFLGNVSHELRTPIFAIQTYLETLIDGGINDPQINLNYLKKAYENLERLNQLLKDLIDISQIEARQLRLSFRYLDINDIIERVIEDIKLLSQQKNIQIEFIKDESLKELVWCDKERLYQILFNLVDNALRHNPPQTQVKIYYKKVNASVRIFVEDNGVGIPEEDLPRIFERFYRVNKERSRESGGTGLGLSIVKHLVEAHGSKIYVESKTGEGTKFYFDLKIA